MIDENVARVEEKKEEEVKQPKVLKPKPEAVTRTLSDKDATVAGIIESQGGFPSVDVVEKHQNRFALPKECEPYSKKYDFRWVSKDPRMLSNAIVKGWRVCNSVNTPWMPKYLIAAHGGVETPNVHGHLLAFRPKELGDAYRMKFQRQSIESIKAAKKDGERDKKGSPFYTAKLSPDEQDKEGETEDFVQGRDFE